jgi:hypothetical protein
MSNNAAWLLLSFAIMVVAVLVTFHEKFEALEKRLNRLEAGRGSDDHGMSTQVVGSIVPEAFRRRDPGV